MWSPVVSRSVAWLAECGSLAAVSVSARYRAEHGA